MTAMLRAVTMAGSIWLAATTVLAAPSLETALKMPDSVQPAEPASVVAPSAPDDSAAAAATVPTFEPTHRGSYPGSPLCGPCSISPYGDGCYTSIGAGIFDDYPSCRTEWFAKAGAVILNRSGPDPARITNNVNGQVQISGGEDFDFGWGGGADVSLAHQTDRGDFLELRYFGALNWNSRVDYGAPGPVQIGGFANSAPNDLAARYNSTLNSTEINWLVPMARRVSLLAGFRWIEMRDDLHYHLDFNPVTADYIWNENNHLYGGQLGANVALWDRGGPLVVNSTAKAGVYGNTADNSFSLRTSNNSITFDDGDRDGPVSFVGEMNLTGGYRLTPHIALRCGYQLLWIDGVALASAQGAAATLALAQNAIDAHDHVFYQGAMTGVDYTW